MSEFYENGIGNACMSGKPKRKLSLVIADNSVTTSKIAYKAVTYDKMADGAVGTNALRDEAVTKEKIAKGAVTTCRIKDGSVTHEKLTPNAVHRDNLLNGSVARCKIANNAVDSSKIENGAVISEKIAKEAVTEDKIAKGAVTTEKIDPLAITSNEIAPGAVLTCKIANGAVTNSKLADGHVTTNKLEDGAVSTRKIQREAVDASRLAKDAVTTEKIEDGAVDYHKIANKAVTSGKLNDEAVVTRTIAPKAVTREKLTDGLIGTEQVEDKAITTQKLACKGVTTGKLADGAVTLEKIGDDVKQEAQMAIQEVKDSIEQAKQFTQDVDLQHIEAEQQMEERINTQLQQQDEEHTAREDEIESKYGEDIKDLQNQIDGMQMNGLAVSNRFGTDPHIGVSQKTLTEALNKLWNKIGSITGEQLEGFQLQVSPAYYIGEEGADVHIVATSADMGQFDHIAIYFNGELAAEAEETDRLEVDATLEGTTVIRCDATILGLDYSEQETVVHYSSFWLGAGQSYEEVMDNGHLIPITNGMRGAYDITCNEGDHIFVIVGEKLREGFIRADIDGFEIPFDETAVTVDENLYKVFTSRNIYLAGEYNIDING